MLLLFKTDAKSISLFNYRKLFLHFSIMEVCNKISLFCCFVRNCIPKISYGLIVIDGATVKA